MDPKKIGAFIHMMREEKQMTLDEFARASSLDPQVIMAYEAGTKN